MSSIPLSRGQIDAAGDLDFATPPRRAGQVEKDVSITIEASPAGLTVRVDYQGPLSSIPAAVERLRASGVLELVSAARATPAPAPATNGSKPSASKERVNPAFRQDGTEVCPEHRDTPLRPGKWGKFCPHKDRASGEYCKRKFAEDGDLI